MRTVQKLNKKKKEGRNGKKKMKTDSSHKLKIK